MSQFSEAEQRYRELEERLIRGDLAEDAFLLQVSQLRVVGDDGRRWMLSGRSGHWLVYDGLHWVFADPAQAPTGAMGSAAPVSRPSLAEAIPAVPGMPSARPARPAVPRWLITGAAALLLIGCIVGMGAAGWVLFFRDMGDGTPPPATGTIVALVETWTPRPATATYTPTSTRTPTRTPTATLTPIRTNTPVPTVHPSHGYLCANRNSGPDVADVCSKPYGDPCAEPDAHRHPHTGSSPDLCCPEGRHALRDSCAFWGECAGAGRRERHHRSGADPARDGAHHPAAGRHATGRYQDGHAHLDANRLGHPHPDAHQGQRNAETLGNAYPKEDGYAQAPNTGRQDCLHPMESLHRLRQVRALRQPDRRHGPDPCRYRLSTTPVLGRRNRAGGQR